MLVCSCVLRVSALVSALKRGRKRNASAHFLNVGDMDGTVDGLDATGRIGLSGLGRLFDRSAAFDDDTALGGVHEQHGAALAFVVAGDDFDFVAFFDVGLDAAHGDGKVRLG